MQIKNGKDFWAGLMFLAFGLGFGIVAYNNYNMGTAVRMGPAYFPVMLGGLLAVLGVFIFLRSFASKIHHSLRVLTFRPWVFAAGCVLAAIAYFVKGSNEFLYQLVLAAALIMLQAAFGTRALYMVLAAVVLFAFLLKPLGLLIATAILVIVSRVPDPDFRWADLPKTTIYGLAVIAVFAVLLALLQSGVGVKRAAFISMLIAILLAIYGSRKIKGTDLGALFAILGIFCVVVFGHGLGLPFNACPDVLDDACRKIGLGS
jgi:hypothetical protein